MVFRLTPQDTGDEERYALGFEALDDIDAGDTYTDETGKLMSKEELSRRLRESKEARRVVRCKLSYRLPDDPPERLRTTYVNTVVFGRMDAEQLARVVHHATRTVYDTLRGRSDG